MHQQLLRRRRKKGELLERTLIGALGLQAKGMVVLGEEKDGSLKVVKGEVKLKNPNSNQQDARSWNGPQRRVGTLRESCLACLEVVLILSTEETSKVILWHPFGTG